LARGRTSVGLIPLTVGVSVAMPLTVGPSRARERMGECNVEKTHKAQMIGVNSTSASYARSFVQSRMDSCWSQLI